MSALEETVLTSVQQYHSEVLRLPNLTRSEETELVRRARSGDKQAKDELIQSCLRYVAFVASRYARLLEHDDYLDIVSVGNMAIVECFEKALKVDNPVAYLYGVAKIAMKSYCFTHSQLIAQQRGKPFVWVDSLDAPLGNSKACYADFLAVTTSEAQRKQADFTRLYEAINAITPKQRYVILRFFGLDGDAPEPLAAISRRLSTTNPKVTIACNRYNMAIRSLRRKLLQ
jgi:RNA polymerase sigma factor (sigma-70 family)